MRRDLVWRPWLAFGLWALTIFATVPVARSIQGFVAGRWGRSAFALAVAGVAVAAALGAVGQGLRRRSLSLAGGLWLAGVSTVFVGYTFVLRSTPEEAIHFVEYGVLGALATRALRPRIADASLYVAAVLIAALVGIIDEAFQWAVPGRVWDLRDIGRNVFAAALVQAGLAGGLPPPEVSRTPGAAGLTLVARLAIVALLLLGASLLNTPHRIGWVTQRIPALAYLAHKPSAMFEYGYLHEDPEVGRFRSRFSIAELQRVDAVRAEEAGRILAQSGGDADSYASFLRRHSPVTDPFLHEVRVHLYSRDYHVRAAQERVGDGAREQLHASIALRENQVLERYFPHTLHQSGRGLGPAERVRLEARGLPEMEWESWASRDLVTRVRERDVVALLAAALGMLVIFERVCARRAAARDPRS